MTQTSGTPRGTADRCYTHRYQRAVHVSKQVNLELEFDKNSVKWPLKVIQGHVFWDQWKACEGFRIPV